MPALDRIRPRPPRRRLLLALVVALLAGCGLDLTQSPAATPSTSIADPTTAAAVRSIESFWQATLPELYGHRYEQLDPARVRGMRPSDRARIRCEGSRFTYGDVAENAFAAPCPEGIAVLWDDAALMPRLQRAFGPAAPAVVLAHEWGHVAQFQAGVRLPTVYAEQQADCFAGAWVAATRQDAPTELASLGQQSGLDGALATVVTVRDPAGTDPRQQQAHGSGFDRVRAFQEGYDGGPQVCADYARHPPTLVEFPFRTLTEAQSGGNLRLADLVELATADLDAFFARAVPGFRPVGTMTLDRADSQERALLTALARIGDGAPATLLALQWAAEAQQTAGVETKGTSAALQRACLAGGWLATLLSDSSASGKLSLSPGDLDESIIGLLSLAGANRVEVGGNAGSYELVSAFRQGVLRGASSCRLPG